MINRMSTVQGSQASNFRAVVGVIQGVQGFRVFVCVCPYAIPVLRCLLSGLYGVPRCESLRVHVPIQHILQAQCIYIGSTLRPMYILCEYMDPQGNPAKGLYKRGATTHASTLAEPCEVGRVFVAYEVSLASAYLARCYAAMSKNRNVS